MTEENDIDMTWNGNKDLSVAISFIKSPPWIEGEENFNTKYLLRELLQKCSGGKVIEMLKSILSFEERCALIKTEFVIKTETQLEEDYRDFNSEMNPSLGTIKVEPTNVADHMGPNLFSTQTENKDMNSAPGLDSGKDLTSNLNVSSDDDSIPEFDKSSETDSPPPPNQIQKELEAEVSQPKKLFKVPYLR